MYPDRGSNSYTVVKDRQRFLYPLNLHYPINIGYSEGGPTLYRAEFGMRKFYWTVYSKQNDDIVIRRIDSLAEEVIFNKSNVTQLDLTFDQNMHPFVVYVENGRAGYFYSAGGEHNFVTLPEDIKFPRCELDIREEVYLYESDIILGYTRSGNLCYRVQREDFRIEHLIATDKKKTMLWKMGNTTDGRFAYQWR